MGDTRKPGAEDEMAVWGVYGDQLAGHQCDGSKQKIFTVLLVDDHIIMRQGLSSLLDEHSDIQIVGEASDGEEAVGMARELRPDIILMDINMPGMNGMEATRIIHSEMPQTRIIALSMHDELEVIQWVLDAGATAFLTKNCDTGMILAAIRGTIRGEETPGTR